MKKKKKKEKKKKKADDEVVRIEVRSMRYNIPEYHHANIIRKI